MEERAGARHRKVPAGGKKLGQLEEIHSSEWVLSSGDSVLSPGVWKQSSAHQDAGGFLETLCSLLWHTKKEIRMLRLSLLS